MRVLAEPPHGVERGRGRTLSDKGTNPTLWVPSHSNLHQNASEQKALPPNTISWGVRASTKELGVGGRGHIQSITSEHSQSYID